MTEKDYSYVVNIISQTTFFFKCIICTGNTYIAVLSDSYLLPFYGRFRGPSMTEVNIFCIQAL